jgi:hypothetical protein
MSSKEISWLLGTLTYWRSIKSWASDSKKYGMFIIPFTDKTAGTEIRTSSL